MGRYSIKESVQQKKVYKSSASLMASNAKTIYLPTIVV